MSGMRVMVVDDEPDVRVLFQQRFRKELKAGLLELFFVLSGEDALAFLEKQSVADIVLILSDINMPGMSGLELLKILKERYSHLKVYMITAYDDGSKRRLAFEYGCDDYLTKPLDFAVLKEKLIIP